MSGSLGEYQSRLLRDLVGFDTTNPPGREEAAARYLADALSELGFETVLQPVSAGRCNLVATYRSGPGPEIVLSGHLDVVHADPGRWRGDPFTVREEGGRLYGRGVVDMKGAITSMLAAAEAFLAKTGGAFGGTVGLVFVADEELGATGTRAYVASGVRPDAVIIGEPTGMDVCIAHRGTCRFHLDVSGRSGHSSRPDEACNAITTAARIADIIDRHNRDTLGKIPHDILPPPSMAVTVIHGGSQTNTIPGECRLSVDRRTLPGERVEDIRDEVLGLIQALPAGSAQVNGPEFFVAVPAGGPASGGRLAGDCGRVLSGMGLQGRVRDFTASCDLAYFTGAGIDCVLVGPGNISEAHTDDEFVDEEQLVLAREFYLAFLLDRLVRS